MPHRGSVRRCMVVESFDVAFPYHPIGGDSRLWLLQVGWLQITAHPPEGRRVPPPVLLEAHIGVHLDDEERLRGRVVDEIAGQLSEPRRRDALRPRVRPLRRDQQRAELASRGQRPRARAARNAQSTKGRPLAPSTVHVLHGIVSSVFRAAVRDRLITSSPCEATKLPRKVRPKIVPLSIEAVDGLAYAVPEKYRALVILCAGMGLRQGEAFGLAEDRVDFLRRKIEVDRQLVGREPTGRPRFGPPKTAASVRTIPLPDVVGEALAEHLRVFGTGPDGLLFRGEHDVPLRRPCFSKWVWRAAVAAVDAAPAGTGMHDLRHFYASLLIRHGSRSRSCRRGWATRRRPGRSTRTRTSGRTRTT
jgi:integrase